MATEVTKTLSPCAPVHIDLRKKLANFRVGESDVSKNKQQWEKYLKQNLKKLQNVEQFVQPFLTHDKPKDYSYESEEAIFGYNHPGFCYKRNGKPRTQDLNAEINSKPFMYDLEGKNGLITAPATSIVSDTPGIAEILSAPEIVNILCELRKTKVLMRDTKLLEQFSVQFRRNATSNNYQENPISYLIQYRKNLINDFFTLFKKAVDSFKDNRNKMSTTSILDRTKTRNFKSIESSFLLNISKSGFKSLFNEHSAIYNDLTAENWNEGLNKNSAQSENKSSSGSQNALTDEETDKDDESYEAKLDRTNLGWGGVPSLYSSRKIGFSNYRKSKSVSGGRLVDLEPERKNFKNSQNSTLIGKEDPKAPLQEVVATARKSRAKTMLKQPAKENEHQKFADELDQFIKKIISDVENINEMKKRVAGIERKKINKDDHFTGPLFKLLKKNKEIDAHTSDIDKIVMNETHSIPKEQPSANSKPASIRNSPKPGGFTFSVPFMHSDVLTNNALNKDVTSIANGENSDMLANNVKSEKLLEYVKAKINASDNREKHRSSTMTAFEPTNCSSCGKYGDLRLPSIQRICCAACRAKLKLTSSTSTKNDYVFEPPKDQKTGWRPFVADSLSLHKGTTSYSKGLPGFIRKSLNQEGLVALSAEDDKVPSNHFLKRTKGATSSFIVDKSFSLKRQKPQKSQHRQLENDKEPWTLKVAMIDLIKLKNELDDDAVKERVSKFEENVLRR